MKRMNNSDRQEWAARRVLTLLLVIAVIVGAFGGISKRWSAIAANDSGGQTQISLFTYQGQKTYITASNGYIGYLNLPIAEQNFRGANIEVYDISFRQGVAEGKDYRLKEANLSFYGDGTVAVSIDGRRTDSFERADKARLAEYADFSCPLTLPDGQYELRLRTTFNENAPIGSSYRTIDFEVKRDQILFLVDEPEPPLEDLFEIDSTGAAYYTSFNPYINGRISDFTITGGKGTVRFTSFPKSVNTGERYLYLYLTDGDGKIASDVQYVDLDAAVDFTFTLTVPDGSYYFVIAKSFSGTADVLLPQDYKINSYQYVCSEKQFPVSVKNDEATFPVIDYFTSIFRFERDYDFGIAGKDFEIVAEPGKLVFKNLISEKFDHVWIALSMEIDNGDGTTINKEVLDTYFDYPEYSGDITFDIDLPDGTYYLVVSKTDYVWDESESLKIPNESYSFFQLTDELSVSVKNNTPKFYVRTYKYSYFKNNLTLFNSRRFDADALAYYTQPSDDIQSDDAKILQLSHEITKNTADDYSSVSAIHDWVAENIYYDLLQFDDCVNPTGSSDYDKSALGALRDKKAVCSGYAALFAALCRAADIPAKVVSGWGSKNSSYTINFMGTRETVKTTSTSHAWNEVYVNGRWIIVDTTWDSGNQYTREGTWVRGDMETKYFDIGISELSSDHVYDDYSEDMNISTKPSDIVPRPVAAPTSATVLVDGKTVAFGAYNIYNNNYFKLRDLAYALNGSTKQFEVGYNDATKEIALTSNTAYTPVGGEMASNDAGAKTPAPTSSIIYLDGKAIAFTAYNINGNNYFKLRDVGETLDFGVKWDGSNNTIVIDTSIGYTPE